MTSLIRQLPTLISDYKYDILNISFIRLFLVTFNIVFTGYKGYRIDLAEICRMKNGTFYKPSEIG